jgi:alpha-beta hydrolase superfamily lysophospholipase
MEKVVFRNSLNQRLFGVLHRGSPGPRLGATIVLCHGMMSAKEGTKQKAFAQVFEESGFSVLRFDFSFCGESEGRFEEITFAQEVDDLRAAVGCVRARGGNPVGLLGSSMGGAVALLYASGDPSIKALVTLAAVGRPAGIADGMGDLKQKTQEWKDEGYQLGAEGEPGENFFEDARKQDVLGAARRVAAPLLVLHGGLDEVVPVEDAHAIHANAGGPKALKVLPGGDHRFTRPEDLEEVLNAARDWFMKYLKL